MGVRRVITRCVINGGCLGRWLGGGRESDYTMCNQWWVLVKVEKRGRRRREEEDKKRREREDTKTKR